MCCFTWEKKQELEVLLVCFSFILVFLCLIQNSFLIIVAASIVGQAKQTERKLIFDLFSASSALV